MSLCPDRREESQALSVNMGGLGNITGIGEFSIGLEFASEIMLRLSNSVSELSEDRCEREF